MKAIVTFEYSDAISILVRVEVDYDADDHDLVQEATSILDHINGYLASTADYHVRRIE